MIGFGRPRMTCNPGPEPTPEFLMLRFAEDRPEGNDLEAWQTFLTDQGNEITLSGVEYDPVSHEVHLFSDDFASVVFFGLYQTGLSDCNLYILQNLGFLAINDEPNLTHIDIGGFDFLTLIAIQYCGLTHTPTLPESATEIYMESNTAMTGILVVPSSVTSLEISHCQITGIDLPPGSQLAYINAHVNQIASTEFLKNAPNFFGTYLTLNPYTSIDISDNPALTGLQVQGSGITSLDISNNLLLTHVVAGGEGAGTPFERFFGVMNVVESVESLNIEAYDCPIALDFLEDLIESMYQFLIVDGNPFDMDFRFGGATVTDPDVLAKLEVLAPLGFICNHDPFP